MERILITGITGYIGSHLARQMLSRCEVYGLVREPLQLTYIQDIQNQLHLLCYDGTLESILAALEISKPSVVYHMAAYYTGSHGLEQTPRLLDSNIILGAYLLEAMTACGCSALVYASTVMAYYQGEAYRPLNLYAATKQAFSDLLAYYTDCGFLRAATLVLSDTYGPGDQRPKVLNLVRKAALTGERLELSDGGQDYDAVYIDDAAAAFVQAGEQLLRNQTWRNETFQVAAPEPLTLRQTVEKMLQVNGLTLRAAWGQRPAAEREIRRVVRKFPPVPGWTPTTSLDEGLKK